MAYSMTVAEDVVSVSTVSDSQYSRCSETMQIFLVQAATNGKTKTLNVNSLDSVGTIKVQMQKKLGIPVDQQRLIYLGVELENGRTLLECNIQKESTVHLVLRLKGGMSRKTTATQLPDYVTGKKLRSLSDTNKRSVRHCNQTLRSDQQKCHRIPNSILTIAYNNTDDQRIKRDIVKFNYSSDNIRAGTNNKQHSAMENAFIRGNPTSSQYEQKKSMLKSAIVNLDHYKKDYARKSVTHVLMTLVDVSSTYNSAVADLDKRDFNSKQVKKVIARARKHR